ncbi:divisome protein SepX/GlpR [Allocatelliglobosispora scoriae]|uniref:divisome protein SepX/GlpR n=1 Tax=Allocatelliglobosispora scoriae TaxID=643052 RepID=UPI0028AD494A|nr:hypothetical protein [Allocatelliglobosispora scoriae]
MRVPTSVLLAVLTAAGLLALAPALVRRYDATERLVAERATSTARVLSRHRRKRTVPGRLPVNPPRAYPTITAAPATGRPTLTVVPRSGVPYTMRAATGGRSPHKPAVYRRRRVLTALAALNVVELIGVVLVGPGFWISLAVTAVLLAAYMGHLRTQAIQLHRRRRDEASEARWLEHQQALVRQAQRRRAETRREAARQLQEELARQRALVAELQAQAEAQASIPMQKAVGEGPVISYRGRSYSARPKR